MLSPSEIDHWLTDSVSRYRAKSMYIPYDSMSKNKLYPHWTTNPHPALSELALYQLDDIGDMFAKGLREALPKHVVHPPVADVQADLAILGFGVNGHVAFHEPHVPWTFRFGEVTLSDETSAQFNLPPETKAVTFGLGAIMETKAVLLIVFGKNKLPAFFRYLRGDPTIPAVELRKHRDLTVMVDVE